MAATPPPPSRLRLGSGAGGSPSLEVHAGLSHSTVNPFVNLTQTMPPSQKAKMTLIFFTLFPFRLVLLLASVLTCAVLSVVATAGVPVSRLSQAPLPAWRRFILRPIPSLFRVFLLSLGFWRIKTKGKCASKADAPIIVSNHLGFVEATYFLARHKASAVSAIENTYIPCVGAIIKAIGCIIVDRTPGKTTNVVEAIKARARPESPFPHQTLIFPEGTVTNQRAVIFFKRGAFLPGVPVQPCAVRLTNDKCCSAWVAGGPPIWIIVLRMMCQLSNTLEVEYLPVYEPSPQEQADAALYARNVQQLIARTLQVPCTDHSYEDVSLAMSAVRLRVPAEDAVIELNTIRKRFNVDRQTAKGYLARFAEADTDRNGLLRFKEFAQAFGGEHNPEESAMLKRLFTLLDENNSGSIDFREFVIGLAMLNEQGKADGVEGAIGALKLAFSVLSDENGYVSREGFRKILRRPYPDLTNDQVYAFFDEADQDRDGLLSMDEFVEFARNNEAHVDVFRKSFFGHSIHSPRPTTPSRSSAKPKAD